MKDSLYSRCVAYIYAQGAGPAPAPRLIRPVVTISRETAAGAITVAQMVSEMLRAKQKKDEVPWTVFDRNLVEKVLQDHTLPTRISEFMPEDTRSNIREAVEEILNLHPSDWTLLQYTTDTILRLAHAGNVIIVGRGSSIITAHLRHALHVRLVAPLRARIAHAQAYYKMTRKEAVHFVHATDRARARYVKRHLGERIDDPLHYHFIINTERTGFKEAANLIVGAVEGICMQSPVVSRKPRAAAT